MSKQLPTAELQHAVMSSFMMDIHALKPGNVSDYSAGHDMHVEDFIKSAELTSPILCDAQLSVGERVLASVQATFPAVGCNTNLGMLLLIAPLVRAAEMGIDALHLNLSVVLQGLDAKDTDCIFAAIRHANPGGLGDSEQYDVNTTRSSETTLHKAMEHAKHKDLIAKQYVTDFIDIFLLGFRYIERFNAKWNSVQWATVACYMGLMAQFPDSHIGRKFGVSVNERIKIISIPIAKTLQSMDNPKNSVGMLIEFDRLLKVGGLNPGTIADLTVASLLVYYLRTKN